MAKEITHEEEMAYRKVLAERIAQNALARAESVGKKISENEAARIGEWWANEEAYDCDLTYWENIDNLIERVVEQR